MDSRDSKWIVSHKSALEFWRRTYAKNALAGKRLRGIKPQTKPLNAKALEGEVFRDLSIPLHVLVGDGNARKVQQNLQCHVSSGEFPYGSFLQTASGYIVSCPELCFLQMAGEISIIELIMLGYEFCGSYRLCKESNPGTSASDQGFRNDLPLTNVAGLDSYATRAVGLKGRTNAMKVLDFIADGSASPMETILTMLLTLPYRLGGYGLPKPLLNYRIDVSAKVKNSEGKSTFFYCDLYWPNARVAVEYDSKLHHTGIHQINKDAIRRNALTSTGIKVINVSIKQITETPRLRELSEVLSKLLGKRLKYPIKEFTFRQAKLLEQLLPWMSSDR